MIELLLFWVALVMCFIGWQLWLVASFLRARMVPLARNEVEAEGENVPEPKQGR